MKDKTDNFIMKTTFSVMCRILQYIDKSLDSDIFDSENFTPEHFGITRNRFARILGMMIQEGFITGIKVSDYGEPDAEDPFEDGKKYERFGIKIENPSITVQGIRFQAENTAIMKVLQAARNIKDVAGFIKP